MPNNNDGPSVGTIFVLGGLAVGALALIIGGCSSMGTVGAGQRGVVTRMGAVTGEIKGEGLYFKTPFVESITIMDVRQQKVQVKMEGASKDLQSISAEIALNVSVMPGSCATLFQTVGQDYDDKVVAPTMQESFKAVIAHYTAEELITKREDVRSGMATTIAARLTPLGIQTNTVNIVDLNFSQAFNHAIEAKVTAQQNALAAENLLAQKRFEAQQVVATAKGKAEAMQIESEALAKNPQVLQLRALEKWNGTLPLVTGGTMPFIDIQKMVEKKD